MPKLGHAEYMRNYRAVVKARAIRSAHQEGVNEGLRMACKFLAQIIGPMNMSGYDSARRLANATLAPEARDAAVAPLTAVG